MIKSDLSEGDEGAERKGGGRRMTTATTAGGLSPMAQAAIEKHMSGPSKRILLSQTANKKSQARDATTITDVCCSEHMAEVEIFSLLEEQIPKYKVRADSMTQFGGYENEDWFIPFPALAIPAEGLGLTKDMCRETLNYFLLSGNRVSQMTRAYDDIEAVSRLLEEKEKDLELTVQIGKELLQQNNRLEGRVQELENDLKESNEQLSQMAHELHQKNDVIAILTNDVEDRSEGNTPTTSKSINFDLLQKRIHQLEDENKSLKQETAQIAKEFDECEEQEKRLVADITAQLSDTNMQFEGLSLELERYKEENRLQYEQILSLTERLQETEMRLHQITTENEEQGSLLEVTRENQNLLAGELVEFKERYQEVLALLQETQEQLRKQRKRGLSTVRSSLIPGMPTQHAADSLHLELMESSLYSDHSLDSGISSDREQMGGTGTHSLTMLTGKEGLHPMMNSSMMSASSMGMSGMSGHHHMMGGSASGHNAPYKKVFETVRCATKTGNFAEGLGMTAQCRMSASLSSNSTSIYSGGSSSQKSSTLVGGGPTASTISGTAAGNDGTIYNSGLNLVGNSYYPSYDGSMGAKTYSKESLISDSDDNYPAQASVGVPGVPGAKDLEAALRRLTPADVLARRAMLSHAPPGTYSYESAHAAGGVRTPDSIMSFGSSGLSSSVSTNWRLPEKLQIVKPMEGSQTLHHWSKLATPTLSGLLDDRPGVKIRGGRDLDELGLKTYSLNDIEEDEDDNPGKRFPVSNSVYTFTNSTVMHPDDGTTLMTFSIPPSQMSSQVSSVCHSRQTTAPPTPRQGLSRRNSCSTFSVNMGLASVLNERGIKAVTPSALNTPAGANFSPTITPCNSPEGSPTRSRSPDTSSVSARYGQQPISELLKRKLLGPERQSRIAVRNQLSRLDKRMMRPPTCKILERVESLGLDNVMSLMDDQEDELGEGAMGGGRMISAAMALNQQQQRGGGLFTTALSRNLSPMAQLTSLKGCMGVRGTSDLGADPAAAPTHLVIKKEAIKAVLNKAMQSNEMQRSQTTAMMMMMSNYDGDLSDTQSEASRSDFSDNKISASISNNTNSSSRLTNKGAIAREEVTSKNSNSSSKSNNASNPRTVGGGASSAAGNGSMSEARVKQMQRQKSRRTMMAGGGGQRPDLGTVSSKVESKSSAEGRSATKERRQEDKENKPAPSAAQTFVGSISSLLFGRKGGLL